MLSRMHTNRAHHKKTERGNGHHGSGTKQETLIEGLNHDLASEYQAMLMYIQYSAKLTGPHRRQLRDLFGSEIADEQKHAQFLADKICALGGEPTVEPWPVPHADNARDMLHRVLDLEQQAITNYSERVQQAESFGDIGLKVELENLAADETRHKEEIQRILAGWDDSNKR